MDNLNLLKEIKGKLQSEFPIYIDKVILYGSRVKGNASEYSDYDILILLKKDYDQKTEESIIDSIYDLDLKYNILIDPRIISQNEMKSTKRYQPFISEAFEYGIEI